MGVSPTNSSLTLGAEQVHPCILLLQGEGAIYPLTDRVEKGVSFRGAKGTWPAVASLVSMTVPQLGRHVPPTRPPEPEQLKGPLCPHHARMGLRAAS